MDVFSFEIIKNDSKSSARLGIIHTAHGDIRTPAFVPVGTQATVKAMSNEDLTQTATEVFFVNTYHMYLRPGVEVINKFGGLHGFIGWKGPLMTDSAGFQIFSLGRPGRRMVAGQEVEVPLVKIQEDGVVFCSHLDGSEHVFTPEKSIEIQSILGADMMIAFDECTFYPATKSYSQLAMERTHRWALRCLEESSKFKVPLQGKQSSKFRTYEQALYGVVQGGIYEDLRVESAKFISSQPFSGIAVGGVSVGESKKEMRDVLGWVVPNLPNNKPRHLLGVGEIDDIFALVEAGIDTFDCVMPTRLGRMGHALTKLKINPPAGGEKLKVDRWTIDLNKAQYAFDEKPIEEGCKCFVCQSYRRAYIHHLFRAKELLGYRLATFHNLHFMNKLVSDIRSSLEDGCFRKLKKEWLQ